VLGSVVVIHHLRLGRSGNSKRLPRSERQRRILIATRIQGRETNFLIAAPAEAAEQLRLVHGAVCAPVRAPEPALKVLRSAISPDVATAERA
jgi:hypothetical protein